MTKILLVYYSQSGEAGRVTEALAESLSGNEVHLTIETLQPKVPYPFPWKRIGEFFDVLPECHWGPLPSLEPIQFDPDLKFDLIILVYQVWFLAPSLPIQSFFKSREARVLQNSKVLTVCVSRNMWQSAAETMKSLLRQQNARHLNNIAVTHQGPVWATFITTPRSLLFGKKDAFWRIFPPSGLGKTELDRIRQVGKQIIAHKEKINAEDRPDNRYALAERVGWHCFRWWGRRIQALGRWGKLPRRIGVYLFVVFLVCLLPVVLPVTMIIRLLLRPSNS